MSRLIEESTLNHGSDQLLQLDDVGREGPDSLGCLFSCHGVFVECKAEGFFIELDFFEVAIGIVAIEFLLQRAVAVLQFLKESW